ncbi:ABC superfamily ATP binding cassette transporter, membrane protein [Lactobacillus selangorensis]|uniref:ABC superfamily ATP binding cassette transporter, membrane protein n=1 Tax=Lactobacillus selangorensis TaxID=81857 RepID=A0A0R2FF96_9LACO|nr:sugar ABC transporter permease [Lactobacillus selangorensis]KRN27282.1 ABC superfamily ATP binding cassette transporter, membrane protein [Lactobacillus selangorensis]KRN29935.1 ABC superfamily ATP binding cassette transporter, membrane protein [Lactobacillus selangorensis]
MEADKTLKRTVAASQQTVRAHLRIVRQPAVWFLLPSVLILCVFVFYPMGKTIYNSFFAANVRGEAVKFVGWANYRTLFKDPLFLKSLSETFVFVLVFAVLTLLIGIVLARLATLKLRRMKVFRTAFAGTMGTSAAAAAILWLFLFNPSVGMVHLMLKAIGLPNVNLLVTPLGAQIVVILTSVWMALGFAFLILLSAFQNVAPEYYEVAAIAGWSDWQQTLKITVPMISPTLFFLFVIEVIDGFKMFAQIDLITGGGPDNATNFLAYKIYLDAFVFHHVGIASAESVILTVLIIFVTWIQFHYTERKVYYA